MKLYAQIVVDLGDRMFNPDDPEETEWFQEEIMAGELILHSNDLGDGLGPVQVMHYWLVE